MGLLGFKLALLLAYLRVGGFDRTHRIVIYVVIVVCCLNQVAFSCILMFSCHPVCDLENPDDKDPTENITDCLSMGYLDTGRTLYQRSTFLLW